jgi:hypothetical protein
MLSPMNFADLRAESVYYELLGCQDKLLQQIRNDGWFDIQSDDTINYYRATTSGSYVRAEGNRGEFVRFVGNDGDEVFFHYSQVFGPTEAAHKQMNLLTYVLGAVYQNTYRQKAALTDLLTEAEALNEYMRTLHRVYFDFAANTVNYDSAHVGMVQEVTPALLKFYKNAGLTFPLNRICEGIIPRIYARIVEQSEEFKDYAWTIFFIAANNQEIKLKEQTINYWYQWLPFYKRIQPPAYTLAELKELTAFKDINKNVTSMNGIAASIEEHRLESRTEPAGISPSLDLLETFYATCYFDVEGNMRYSNFFGTVKTNVDLWAPPTIDCVNGKKKVHISDISASLTVPIGDVISGRKKGYIVQREMNAFLDQIRNQMDQLNNELQSVETMIGTHNQDMQQNYGVATSAIEASEETQKRTTGNIR